MKKFTVYFGGVEDNSSFASYTIDDSQRPLSILAVTTTTNTAWIDSNLQEDQNSSSTYSLSTSTLKTLKEVEAALKESDIAGAAKIAEKAGLRVKIQEVEDEGQSNTNSSPTRSRSVFNRKKPLPS